MTCIAAFVDKGIVTIGGDSAGINSQQELQLRADSKVFLIGSVAIGVSGSFRAMQEIKYSLTFPPLRPSTDKLTWMCRDFLQWLRKTVNAEDLQRTELLVGMQGNLYHVYAGEQVSEETEAFDACGCAAQIARGALYALRYNDHVPESVQKLSIALDAAERFSSGVRGPFSFVESR